MDDNRSATENCSWVSSLGIIHLVVVYDRARGLIPYLNPKLINAASAIDLSIYGTEHEAIVALTIDRAIALERGSGTRNYQPLVAGAVEVHGAGLELELGRAGWNAGSLLVLCDKAEVRSARGCLAGRSQQARTRWRVDPSAACDKSTVGLVHDYVFEDRLPSPAVIIEHSQPRCVDPWNEIHVASACLPQAMRFTHRANRCGAVAPVPNGSVRIQNTCTAIGPTLGVTLDTTTEAV